jgi:hypothetical protein
LLKIQRERQERFVLLRKSGQGICDAASRQSQW